ncbi:PAS domain-containing protein [Brasilonema sp. CT11]|nr:PAS domain-containing protein [Brasilonema sp. CT11]
MCHGNEIAKVNQQLALALSAAKMVTWDWDLLSNRVVLSSGDEQLFGLAPGTFPETYEAAMALVHPNDIEAVTLALNQACIDRCDYHQELRIFEPSGRMHWIEAKGRFFYNDEDQAVQMLGIIMEISDRKAKESQLRLLESAVVHTNDAIMITEPEPLNLPSSRITYVNSAFTKLIGYTLEEVLGKTPHILQAENTDQAALDKIVTAMQNWQPVKVDLIKRTKDGEGIWVEASIFPIKDETGCCTHWVSVQRDITERKQAEIVLKQSEERFRQIAENIQDVFWIINPVKQQLIYVSPAYERIWGRKCESWYASWNEWIDSLHPDDQQRVLVSVRERAYQKAFEHEYRIVRPDGTVRWIGERGFPVKDEFGQLQRLIGISQDITERKLAEAALEQLNSELELRVQQRTLELERSQAILQQQVEREQLITRLTQQIRQSLDLATILNNVVVEVQKLLATERVLVYQMQPDKTGRIVAEAVVKEESIRILDRLFPEETFPEQCLQRYLQGEVYILTDLNKAEIIPCFADFLTELEVRAELVVPIIQKQTIWGLLIVHQCHEPREWQTWEINLLKQLTSQMAIAIQQSELYQQLKEELHERLRIELELRRSENLFRSLSELAPMGIFKGDAQGQMIYTNPRCQAICGFTFEEAFGYGWTQFIHPEDRQLSQLQWSALSTHTEFSQEMRFVHRDGTIRFARVKKVLIFSESDELVGHVGTVEDITESQAIEKMKQEFISIVSHELRTPLASIRGSLGLYHVR